MAVCSSCLDSEAGERKALNPLSATNTQTCLANLDRIDHNLKAAATLFPGRVGMTLLSLCCRLSERGGLKT